MNETTESPTPTPAKRQPKTKRRYDIVTNYFTTEAFAWSAAKALKDFVPYLFFANGEMPEDFEIFGVFRSDCVVHASAVDGPMRVLMVSNQMREKPACLR